MNQHIALVRLERDELNPRWVANYLAFGAGQQQFAALNDAGAKAGMSLPSVGSLLVARPNPAEQIEVAETIDAVDVRIAQAQANAAKLILLKLGLAHDLLTGRKRVKV